MNEYQVKAHWDEDVNVWWSESDDVPGLCVEAPTFEELEKRLAELIPELLVLNDIIKESDNKPIRFCVLAEKYSTVTMRAA
jgi:predicted RNase H-like HicB family nuclease